MNDASKFGTLLLVPNGLDRGGVSLDTVLPLPVLQRAAGLQHWVVENAKSTRAFLKRVQALVPLATPLQQIEIVELPATPKGRPTAPPDLRPLLSPLLSGSDVGLLSEAGMPAVADPGAALVARAHTLGIRVLPLVGPSAIVMAVAASGLNGQSFAFVGYVPSEPAQRDARLRELEARSRREAQAQWMIETPYRNAALLAAMLQTLAPATRVSIACALTEPRGWTRTDSVARLRETPAVFDGHQPAMFGLQA